MRWSLVKSAMFLTCLLLACQPADRKDDVQEQAKKDELKALKQRAQSDIKTLDEALAVYHFKNGQFPTNLSKLADPDDYGNPPLVDRKTLIDPWGKAYRYDPGVYTSREVPLVF